MAGSDAQAEKLCEDLKQILTWHNKRAKGADDTKDKRKEFGNYSAIKGLLDEFKDPQPVKWSVHMDPKGNDTAYLDIRQEKVVLNSGEEVIRQHIVLIIGAGDMDKLKGFLSPDYPPVFYSLYKRKITKKEDLLLFNTPFPVVTLVQQEGEAERKVVGWDSLQDLVGQDTNNTLFVILPRKSPGCLAAHEYLRLLYVMLDEYLQMDSEHSGIPLFFLADDDLRGCRYVVGTCSEDGKFEAKTEGGEPKTEGGEPKTEGGEPKTEGGEPKTEGGKSKTGTVEAMARLLVDFHHSIQARTDIKLKPLVLSTLRANEGKNLPDITKSSGPKATTRADSFLLISRNNVILTKPFCPSWLLTLTDEDRSAFNEIKATRINIDAKLPASAVYGQFEDYFLHMLLAHANNGVPQTWVLQGVQQVKSGKGNTDNQVIGPEQTCALSRIKCMKSTLADMQAESDWASNDTRELLQRNSYLERENDELRQKVARLEARLKQLGDGLETEQVTEMMAGIQISGPLPEADGSHHLQ
eukprot:TRINITY_DN8386_c0_g1_i1.p1 TRINITY_DN8386_c0_g1~~TRINITY_DN8386_c0_g1_i1.p1  ORF type:complete len:537 (+),score=15.55 TRINITY_DN8386_c0_g1_i1:41-1612(+)